MKAPKSNSARAISAKRSNEDSNLLGHLKVSRHHITVSFCGGPILRLSRDTTSSLKARAKTLKTDVGEYAAELVKNVLLKQMRAIAGGAA